MVSEMEKMLAGEVFDPLDPAIVEQRTAARQFCHNFNNELDLDKRYDMLTRFLGKTGNGARVIGNLRVYHGCNLHLGDNFFANFDCIILDYVRVTIGDNCMLGPGVHIYSATHPIDPVERNADFGQGRTVTIGNNVWIGGGAIINPGVTLGDNVVVGSGSVVTKSFPDNVVIAGNPARIIREIPESAAQNETGF